MATQAVSTGKRTPRDKERCKRNKNLLKLIEKANDVGKDSKVLLVTIKKGQLTLSGTSSLKRSLAEEPDFEAVLERAFTMPAASNTSFSSPVDPLAGVNADSINNCTDTEALKKMIIQIVNPRHLKTIWRNHDAKPEWWPEGIDFDRPSATHMIDGKSTLRMGMVERRQVILAYLASQRS